MIDFDRDDLSTLFLPDKEFHELSGKVGQWVFDRIAKRNRNFKWPEDILKEAPNCDFAAKIYISALILIQAADKMASMSPDLYGVYISALESCVADFKSGKTVIPTVEERFGVSKPS